MSEEIPLGPLLRAARERRGETLEQAQQRTGISPNLLRELESGEFRIEPVYARLAAANYAAYLGLDPVEITTLFDRQFGRPDIPAPSFSYGRSLGRSPAFIGTVPPTWVIAAAVLVAAAVLLAIFLSGEPEVPAPPSGDAAEIPPALHLTGDGNPATEAEPDPGAGTVPIAALEAPSSRLAETSNTSADTADALRRGAVAADPVVVEAPAEGVAPTDEGVSGTALQEEPGAAAESGEERHDLAASLILRAEAVDSTWVRIQWDGGAGHREEIVPRGESRRWEAAEYFTVTAGRPHGLRFYFQGQLLGGGRLGDPPRVLRFRASTEEVVLLKADLTPLSSVPLQGSTANPGGPRTP